MYVAKTKEQYINEIFKNTKTPYEFFWLKAIIDNLEDKGITNISFDTLINKMIANTFYYAINYQYCSANNDVLSIIVSRIIEKIGSNNLSESNILEYLLINDDKEIQRAKECIAQELPYRFLSVFAADIDSSDWLLPKPKLATILKGKSDIIYTFGSIQGLKTNIYIYIDWCTFLKASKETINELIDNKIKNYITLNKYFSYEYRVANDYIYKIYNSKQEDEINRLKVSKYYLNLINKTFPNTIIIPCVLAFENKLYRVSTWTETFKIIMFLNFYKNIKINKENLSYDVNRKIINNQTIYIKSGVVEDELYTKFSEDLYIHVDKSDYKNLKELNYIKDAYDLKFNLYLLCNDNEIDNNDFLKFQENTVNKLVKNKYIEKKTKYLIGHINGKILSKSEKFYNRIEKEFDNKILIGDVSIGNDEDSILNEFMKKRLNEIDTIWKKSSFYHEKVFAIGLVRYAMRNYQQKTFWPYFKYDFGINISTAKQTLINLIFKNILKKYNKPYFEIDGVTVSIQNICMHTFVCDKCADQLFDYIFDFWRLDLSRSIENCKDESGNDIFDILIDEVLRTDNTQVQDVMIHTTMALQANKRGSRNRLRRILKMIDNSYWNNADYSKSNNRITILFNTWKSNPNCAFSKELKKDLEFRSKGKGEKLLSRPIIAYDRKDSSFSLLLPKQILRRCSEDEHPIWKVNYSNEFIELEPTLLAGKASLYSDKCEIPLNRVDIFNNFSIVLESEKFKYADFKIKSNNIRFFNSRGYLVNHDSGYISKDTVCSFSNSSDKLEWIDNQFESDDVFDDGIKSYSFVCEEGQVFILPNKHAISVGKPLIEGVINSSVLKGVVGKYKECTYKISNKLDKLFFKASKQKLNGTSIKIESETHETIFGKIKDRAYKEFKIDENVEDVYGYLINLSDYIKNEGCFTLTLDIPGSQIHKYSLCYIKDFNYEFIDAPYIFVNSGTIKINSSFKIKTDESWEKKDFYNTLVFSLDESGREEINNYVIDRKLHLDIELDNSMVQLIFDIPVLYWKYKKDDEWSYEEPAIINSKNIPSHIYINHLLNEQNLSIFLDDDLEMKENSLCYPTYDKELESYLFKTIDFKEFLTHDKDYRYLKININNTEYRFLKISCRSIVRSASITGDFDKKLIYGNFDIEGSNNYTVQILKEGHSIEQDIPVENGHFEINCDVREGKYTIVLYELEDDDSGFGSISYEIGCFDEILANIENLNDKNIKIEFIKDRESKYARLHLKTQYMIKKLNMLNYKSDVEDKIDIHSWLYDSSDNDVMSKFTYYTGTLGCTAFYGYKELFDVLLIFDKKNDANSVLIYALEDDEALELLYDLSQRIIISTDEDMPKNKRRMFIKTIDDEIYKINISFLERE